MPDAFRPVGTVSIAASAVSAAVAIPAFTNAEFQVELQNPGDAIAFFRWGATTPTAVVTDYPVLPGQSKLITVDPGANSIAAILGAATTATLYITYGKGA